jgi:hypothetical protein
MKPMRENNHVGSNSSQKNAQEKNGLGNRLMGLMEGVLYSQLASPAGK